MLVECVCLCGVGSQAGGAARVQVASEFGGNAMTVGVCVLLQFNCAVVFPLSGEARDIWDGDRVIGECCYILLNSVPL